MRNTKKPTKSVLGCLNPSPITASPVVRLITYLFAFALPPPVKLWIRMVVGEGARKIEELSWYPWTRMSFQRYTSTLQAVDRVPHWFSFQAFHKVHNRLDRRSTHDVHSRLPRASERTLLSCRHFSKHVARACFYHFLPKETNFLSIQGVLINPKQGAASRLLRAGPFGPLLCRIRRHSSSLEMQAANLLQTRKARALCNCQ